MTILFFVRLFYPHGGGVERHVLEISKRLIKNGHKVIIVTEEIPKPYNINYHSASQDAKMMGNENLTNRFWTSLNDDGIKVYRIPVGKNNFFKKFRIWGWLFAHKNLINNADIVHAHDVFFWYFPFRFLYPSKLAYVTFHGWETTFPPSKKAIFVRKLSEKLAFGNICVGEFIARWYGTRPDYITYGGVDVRLAGVMASRAQPATSEVRKRGGKKIKIILIGRFEEDIGISIYVAALDALKKMKVEFEFEAYGEGVLKKNLQEYGDVYSNTQAAIDKAITEADIVFASSYLTILQVMAAKRLVCSVYDNPLKKDYLTMAPFVKWIIIADSGEALAEKIINIFERLPRLPAGRQVAYNPRNDIEQAYEWAKEQTWRKVTDMYLKLWKSK